jgi:hypothetical protein
MRLLFSRSYPSPALILAALALGLAACSPSTVQQGPTPTSPPSPTTIPAPHATVVEVSNTQHFADSKSGGTSNPCPNDEALINGDCGVNVTASCPNGATVLSGGYALDDPLAFVSSSYDSSASAWTINAHDEGQDGGSHPVTVTAYAVCLQANFAAKNQDASTAPNVLAVGLQTASCPPGTIVTGGGYRFSAGGRASLPSGNGWQADLSVQLNNPAVPIAIAVCAGNHLVAAATPSASKTFNPGDTNGEVSVACAPGQLLVGGGGKGDGPGAVLTNAATDDVSHWHLLANGPNAVASGPGVTLTETAYAVCVTVA